LYLVITTLLGIFVLREPITALKLAGLACMLAGVLALAQPPARFGVHRESNLAGKVPPARGLVLMGTYVVIVGVGAFLEKPALKSLDATQLNALMAIAMTAVAGVALGVSGPRLPLTRGTLAGVGVGAMMGVASVFYFLGLHGLPVSAAAALSNASVIVTVALSTVVLRRPLSRARVGSLALTLLGAVLLALSSG
jgi:drug/metabolite transporter (DMT)-like permease